MDVPEFVGMVPYTGPEIIPLEPDPGNAGVGKRTRWVPANDKQASGVNRFRKTGDGFVFIGPGRGSLPWHEVMALLPGN